MFNTALRTSLLVSRLINLAKRVDASKILRERHDNESKDAIPVCSPSDETNTTWPSTQPEQVDNLVEGSLLQSKPRHQVQSSTIQGAEGERSISQGDFII